MEEIDCFSKEEGNNFNIFRFILNLNFNIESMDINKYSLFVHEYTHYLQSICTVSGISLLFKYFSFVKNIYANLNLKICNNNEYDTGYLSSYIEQYNDLMYLYNYNLDRENLEHRSDYFLLCEKIQHKIYKKEVTEYFIVIKEKQYHVSYKCLRETMAMMTFFIARNYKKEDALKYLQTSNVLPVYKVLFLYFNKNFPYIDDLIRFTYFFTETALQSDYPGKILNLLFKSLKSCSKTSILCTETFFQIFHRENPYVLSALSSLIEKLKKDIQSLNSLGKNNEYFVFVKSYLQRCITGLNEYINKRTFFYYFQDIDKLKLLANVILSPVIIQTFQGNTKVSTLDDQTNSYALALIFGVAVLLDAYIKQDFTPMNEKCIFIEKIPVCKFLQDGLADVKVCNRKPFNIKPFKNGNCIFYNASLILGMLPDEEIIKYKDKNVSFIKST